MKKLLLLSVAVVVVGCAHHRDVRPSENGKHTVVLKTEDKTSGYNMAKRQADHFCEKSGKTAYIGKEIYKYSGSVDEETYKTGKTVSKAATALGTAGAVFGGKKERNAGGLLGVGGAVANSTLGSGYTYTMNFSCK